MTSPQPPMSLDDLVRLLDEPDTPDPPMPEATPVQPVQPTHRRFVTPSGALRRGAEAVEALPPLTTDDKPPADLVDIAEARARKQSRAELVDKSLRTAHQAIDVIAETFAAKGADIDDAIKALPVLHKVLEHVERLEQQRKESAADQPRAVFNIITDRSVRQELPPRRPRATPADDITDI